MAIPIMGDLPRYPMRSAQDQDLVQYTARLTVSGGPAFAFDKSTQCTLTDETGTGVYTLGFPPCRAIKSIAGRVMKQGGTSTLTILVVGSDTLPSASAGTWKFNVYALTVSGGTLALADLVSGDVVDFDIVAQAVA